MSSERQRNTLSPKPWTAAPNKRSPRIFFSFINVVLVIHGKLWILLQLSRQLWTNKTVVSFLKIRIGRFSYPCKVKCCKPVPVCNRYQFYPWEWYSQRYWIAITRNVTHNTSAIITQLSQMNRSTRLCQYLVTHIQNVLLAVRAYRASMFRSLLMRCHMLTTLPTNRVVSW
jgi:hypothetical protein